MIKLSKTLLPKWKQKFGIQYYDIKSTTKEDVIGIFISILLLQELNGSSVLHIESPTIIYIKDILYVATLLYTTVVVRIFNNNVYIEFNKLKPTCCSEIILKLVDIYKQSILQKNDIDICTPPIYFTNRLREINVLVQTSCTEKYRTRHINSLFRQSPIHKDPPIQTSRQSHERLSPG